MGRDLGRCLVQVAALSRARHGGCSSVLPKPSLDQVQPALVLQAFFTWWVLQPWSPQWPSAELAWLYCCLSWTGGHKLRAASGCSLMSAKAAGTILSFNWLAYSPGCSWPSWLPEHTVGFCSAPRPPGSPSLSSRATPNQAVHSLCCWRGYPTQGQDFHVSLLNFRRFLSSCSSSLSRSLQIVALPSSIPTSPTNLASTVSLAWVQSLSSSRSHNHNQDISQYRPLQ